MSFARTAGTATVKRRLQQTIEEDFQRLTSPKHRAVLSHVPDINKKAEAVRQAKTRPPWSTPRNLEDQHAIPLKDNFVTTDLPTTCASAILSGFTGASKSTVARLLEDHGIPVVAKTNMDEFGMGSHSTNSAYGPVKNGHGQHAQSAGGSSGGSAMVVADEMARVAVGSDTGGSVRLPAAYTGIVGFKPSYGRISRNGLVPYANSLDTVGILARNVVDATSLYKILNKYDPSDPTSLTPTSRQRIEHVLLHRLPKASRRHQDAQEDDAHIRPFANVDRDSSHALTEKAKLRLAGVLKERGTNSPLRIGVPNEYNIEEMHPLVRAAWERNLSRLLDLGHEIVDVSLPTTKQALAAYYVLAPAEASSNLAKYDGVRYGQPRDADILDNHNGPLYSHHRGKYFGDEVKRRILLGTFSLSAGAMDNYFIQAQKVRRLVQQDFNAVFRLAHPLMDSPYNPDGVDYIFVPTAPTLPPLLSEVEKQSPLDSYINDVFTVPASLAGLPAISLPVRAHQDLPQMPDRNIGMQLIGQYGDDMNLLKFARLNSEPEMTIRTNGMRVWNRWRL